MSSPGPTPSAQWLRSAWSSLRRLLGAMSADRRSFALVLALLLTDLCWALYYGVARTLYELGRDPALYEHEALLITTDGGVPEWFNYAKTVLLVVIFFRLMRRTHQPIYALLALLFLFVGLDDGLKIHETGGKFFVELFSIPRMFGLRASDIGEVITWLLAGALVLPGLLVALARSQPTDRGNGLAVLLAFGLLVFCAVFVDQLYSNFHDLFSVAGVLIDLVEDGGEMFAITLACALALGAEREARGRGGTSVSRADRPGPS